MAQDETARGAGRPTMPARDTAKLSDDISRVVSFLDNRRTDASDRNAELLQSVAARRDPAAHASPARADPNTELPKPEMRETQASVLNQNPELSVRYHSFCSELDQMLDAFRARVNSTKPVAH